MILSVVIFYICLFAIFEVTKFIGIDTIGFVKVIIFGIVTFISVYPKIKKEGRLFRLSEKIIFLLATWGVYTIFTLAMVALLIKESPTTPGIMIVALNYFLAFCGVWLVISTFAEKLFDSVIKNA